ncbi:NB-ARC domain containing protein [Trema orientale]|uniref:NB-ARC domain containing protein n=1 Tax=Trema orientale TaxID=63057 RepID=A0A2P5FPF7_TREOI|nr:NB-ARC domain containing protein [Trema orientale]
MEQAIDLLIGKIASVVENEVSLLSGVQAELEEIKNELEYMQSFINDASKRGLSDLEKTMVKAVKEKAHAIVDIIDEHTYYSSKKRGLNKFCKAIHLPRTVIEKHRLASKLKEVKRTIKETGERNYRYHGNDHHHHREGHSSVHDANWVTRSIGEAALFQSDEDLVGIDDAKRELLDILQNGGLDRTVISVLGMGGSGKTSLVASIVRNRAVMKHFNGYYAWITVSQSNYTIDNLLRSMNNEFDKREEKKTSLQELSNMNQTELVRRIINKLQQKRYLVVLDDVWEIDRLWLILNPALVANAFGSRIILTTRKEDIAHFSFGIKSHVYNVKELAENMADELFWKKALPHNPHQCSPELEHIAKRLIRKCGGLPLGLAAVGSLMSTKKLEFGEWDAVLHRLNWELSNNPKLNMVKSILLLSFYELPNRLKQCFLYCCIFPEDHAINQERLIRLWIAEGLVESGRGMTTEKMAKSYITELIHRCLLQDIKKNLSSQYLIMHDLNRELFVSIAEDENFCSVYKGIDNVQESRVYRLAMQGNYGEARGSMSKVRSFFVFDSDMVTSSMQKLLCSFSLLRVLDLKDSPILQLPKELMHCYNLTYLCLKRTRIEKLPKAIGKLCNLQTLDIRQTKIQVLPHGIVKLSNLRHLLMRHSNYANKLMDLTHFDLCYSVEAPAGICELKNLQVLDSVGLGKVTVKHLSCMTKLTKIGLTNVKESDGEDLCTLIGRMKSMSFLILQASDVDEVLKIEQVPSVSPFLNKLYLIGKLERTPRWFSSLQCLTILLLQWSRLTDDFLPHISTLPNLTVLVLNKAYEGNKLWFQNGFGKLTVLMLCKLSRLNEIVVEKGVMPSLEELYIIDCSELKAVPRGVQHVAIIQS